MINILIEMKYEYLNYACNSILQFFSACQFHRDPRHQCIQHPLRDSTNAPIHRGNNNKINRAWYRFIFDAASPMQRHRNHSSHHPPCLWVVFQMEGRVHARQIHSTIPQTNERQPFLCVVFMWPSDFTAFALLRIHSIFFVYLFVCYWYTCHRDDKNLA